MPHLSVVSGKAGGLQAMLPMLELFRDSGRWTVELLLCDQHLRDKPFFLDGAWKPLFVGSGNDRLGSLLIGAHTIGYHWREKKRPDLVIVYGDRADALLGATVAHEMRIPVAHLQAGDVTGGIDNANRYAITMLSDYAFCSSSVAAVNVEQATQARQGAQRIETFVVGEHHVDALLRAVEGAKRGEMIRKVPLVVHLHPDTLRGASYNRHMAEQVIDAVVAEEDCPSIWLAPCTDLHGDMIMRAYEHAGITVTPPMPLKEFGHLLLYCRALVGNTSATVIDAPALGVPSVVVGNRQYGRSWYRQYGRSWYSVSEAGDIARTINSLPWNHSTVRRREDAEAGQRTFKILDAEFSDA